MLPGRPPTRGGRQHALAGSVRPARAVLGIDVPVLKIGDEAALQVSRRVGPPLRSSPPPSPPLSSPFPLPVSSVLAGIWNATVPLFTLPVAILWLADERATARRLAGLAVGFVGVLIVLGVWRGLGATSLEGNLLCLGAAASYGLGFPYARKYLARRPEGPLALATAQLMCATAELAVLTAVFTHAPHGVAAKHVLSVVALGVFGTGLTFLLNLSIIRDVGATVASTVAYVMPIFSTLLGVLALGEPLTWYEPLGAAIIIAGAVLAQSRRARRTGTTPSPLDEVRAAPLPAREPAAGDGLLACVELDRVGPVRVQVSQE